MTLKIKGFENNMANNEQNRAEKRAQQYKDFIANNSQRKNDKNTENLIKAINELNKNLKNTIKPTVSIKTNSIKNSSNKETTTVLKTLIDENKKWRTENKSTYINNFNKISTNLIKSQNDNKKDLAKIFNTVKNNNKEQDLKKDKSKLVSLNVLNKPDSKSDEQIKIERKKQEQLDKSEHKIEIKDSKNLSTLVSISDLMLKKFDNLGKDNKDENKDDNKKQEQDLKKGKFKLLNILKGVGLITAIVTGHWSPFLKSLAIGQQSIKKMFANIINDVGGGYVKTAYSTTKNFFSNIWNGAKDAGKRIPKDGLDDAAKKPSIFKKGADLIKSGANKVKTFAEPVISKSKSAVSKVGKGAAGAVGAVANSTKSVLKNGIETGSAAMKNVKSAVGKVGKDAAGAILDKTGLKKLIASAMAPVKTLTDNVGNIVAGKLGLLSKGSKTGTSGIKALGKEFGEKKIKKIIGSKVAKFIPGVGELISLYFATDNFMKGDWGGGLLDLASLGVGLGSDLTGALTFGGGKIAGSTIQIPIIAAQILHDLNNIKTGKINTFRPGLTDKIFNTKKNKSYKASKSNETGDSNAANSFNKKYTKKAITKQDLKLYAANKKGSNASVLDSKKLSMPNPTLTESENKWKNNVFVKAFKKVKQIIKPEELPANIIPNSDNLDFSGIIPDALNNLQGLAADYQLLHPEKPNLFLNSAYRSYEDQVRLYKEKGPGWAAVPGTSKHGFGYAFDLNSAEMNQADKDGLLSKWGFVRPMVKEPWHIQSKISGDKYSSNKTNNIADTPKPAKSQIGDSNPAALNPFVKKTVTVSNNNNQFDSNYKSSNNNVVVVALDKASIKALLDGQDNIANKYNIKMTSTPEININGRL